MQVLTANRLVDGDVAYLATSGAWVDYIEDARLFEGEESTEAETIGVTDEAGLKIVGAYLIDVSNEAGIAPISLREKIRAKGPTVRLDLGKQAAQSAA